MSLNNLAVILGTEIRQHGLQIASFREETLVFVHDVCNIVGELMMECVNNRMTNVVKVDVSIQRQANC